jgi:PBP1b-binding outer membrane lipoprotein LpoB
MKNIIFVLGVALIFASCKNEVMTKPKNLIEQDKMVAIIYDLAILEAMRSQPQQPGDQQCGQSQDIYI